MTAPTISATREAFWTALRAALPAIEPGATVQPGKSRGLPEGSVYTADKIRVRVVPHVERTGPIGVDVGVAYPENAGSYTHPALAAEGAAKAIAAAAARARKEAENRQVRIATAARARSITATTGQTAGGYSLLVFVPSDNEPGRYRMDTLRPSLSEEDARGVVDYLRSRGVLPGGNGAPAAAGPLCPERATQPRYARSCSARHDAALADLVPDDSVACPTCKMPSGRDCLTVADALAMLDAAKREIALVRAGWRRDVAERDALRSIVEEARELRRMWCDRSGSSDDAYGAKSEAFWKRIDLLDAADPSAIDEPLRAEVADGREHVRAALLPEDRAITTDAEIDAFLSADGAKIGERPPW